MALGRTALNMTKAAFARLIGVSKGMVTRWENDEVVPKPWRWKDLCRLLSLTYQDFVDAAVARRAQ